MEQMGFALLSPSYIIYSIVSRHLRDINDQPQPERGDGGFDLFHF